MDLEKLSKEKFIPMIDFFRLYLPYGLNRNADGDWAVFNRNYAPLGMESSPHGIDGLDYRKYVNLNEKLMLALAEDGGEVRRDADGKINRVYLYSDNTNPRELKVKKELWDIYQSKLMLLSGLNLL